MKCLALVLASFTWFQSPTPLVEHWPNGQKKSECGSVEVKGRVERDGDFKSWYETGALEWEGKYQKGARTGTWRRFWPNGGEAERGRFARDRRDGKWFFTREDGSSDPFQTGVYRFEATLNESGRATREGYVRDDQRHGRWTYFWPDGHVQFEGDFKNGQRNGEWVFFGLDGRPVRLFLSGLYDMGKLAERLNAERIAELERAVLASGRVRSVGAPAAAKTLLAIVERSEQPDSEAARASALVELSGGLLALDPASAEHAEIAQRVFERLRGWTRGHDFADHKPTFVERTVEERREISSAWSALLAVCANDAAFWSLDVRAQCSKDAKRHNWPCAVLAHAAPRADERPDKSGPMLRHGAFASRFDRSHPARDDKNVTAAVQSALRWLAAHQSPDGSWDSNGYKAQCGALAKGAPCDDSTTASHDIGVTGLALLAFAAEGNTLMSGPFASNVRRAVVWLLEQQNPVTGLFHTKGADDLHYNHFIATLALAEVYGGCNHEGLKASLEAGLKYIEKVKLPYGAWNYFAVQQGPEPQLDTSISFWAYAALWTASQWGWKYESECRPSVSAFFDEMTDSVTGRTGYNDVGSPSARVTRVNDHFAVELNEALTGAGVWVRLATGQTPSTDPMISKGVLLIARRPPIADPVRLGFDSYAWFLCSQALQCAGDSPAAKGWLKALRLELLGCQSKSGDEIGSWSAGNDAWGYAGGRVMTTALSTLCLQMPYRFDPTYFGGAKRTK